MRRGRQGDSPDVRSLFFASPFGNEVSLNLATCPSAAHIRLRQRIASEPTRHAGDDSAELLRPGTPSFRMALTVGYVWMPCTTDPAFKKGKLAWISY